MNEYYDTLNKLLDSVYFKFINDNVDFIVNAINESISNFENVSFDIAGNFDKEDEKEEVIGVTREFLKYIDSSGKLLNFFNDCINNNIIYLWKSNEREYILKEYIDMGIIIDDTGVVDLCFCSKWPVNIINVPLSGSVSRDVVSLVHELMHCFCFKQNSSFYSYLDEMVAIYFESRAASWLVSNGYNEKEAFYSLNWRNNYEGFNNTIYVGGITLMKFIDFFRIKKRDVLITDNNIVNDNELVFLKGNDYFLEVMVLMIKGEELPKLGDVEEKVLKDNYVCSLIGSISSLLDFSNGYFNKIITYVSYCLGTYISNRFVDCSLDSKMLYIASNMNIVDDSLLIKVLIDDIKCKGMKKKV